MVVALVQANTRFIKDVQHPHQLRTYLRGQANTLRFASAQGIGTPVERQIPQANVQQKLNPRHNLLQHFCGNELRLSFKITVELVKPGRQIGQLHATELRNIESIDAVVQRLLLQASAFTYGAIDVGYVFLGPRLHAHRAGIVLLLAQHIYQALKLYLVPKLLVVATWHLNGFIGPVQQQRFCFFVELPHGRAQTKLVFFRQSADHSESPNVAVLAQRRQSPRRNAQHRVGHDQLGVNLRNGAQAIAMLARPVR